MKKAAIYSQYWDTLGGGERYALSVARALANSGYEVDIEWHDPETIVEKVENRFNISLKKIKFVKSVGRGSGYDVCFWVSDGSVPLLYARKNFLHFQVPFVFQDQVNLMNKMKFFRINKIICNSLFTKKFIDKSFGIKSDVIYPPVDVNLFKPKRKQNTILYVGRFSKLTQSKRHDILIESFKKLYDKKIGNWELVLAGGVEIGVGNFLNDLKKISEGYPVRFVESPVFKDLRDLYGKAKMFWSAAGYGEDQEKNPHRMEHFGITVVEAMASGAVPLVFNGGGFREIVSSAENGFLWNEPSDLIRQTLKLIDDNKQMNEMAREAKSTSKKFSYEQFEKEFIALL